MLLTQENGLIHTIVHNPTNNSSDLGPELFTADGVVLNQRYKMIYQIKSWCRSTKKSRVHSHGTSNN